MTPAHDMQALLVRQWRADGRECRPRWRRAVEACIRRVIGVLDWLSEERERV